MTTTDFPTLDRVCLVDYFALCGLNVYRLYYGGSTYSLVKILHYKLLGIGKQFTYTTVYAIVELIFGST